MLKDLTIGRVAKESGVGVETVRFYERKGLIQQPKREQTGGFRKYAPDDPRKIRFIKRAQDFGFTLREIKDLLNLKTTSRTTCSDVKRRADGKLAEIDAKIADLRKMKRSLKELSEACGEGKQAVTECEVLNCFESGWKC